LPAGQHYKPLVHSNESNIHKEKKKKKKKKTKKKKTKLEPHVQLHKIQISNHFKSQHEHMASHENSA